MRFVRDFHLKIYLSSSDTFFFYSLAIRSLLDAVPSALYEHLSYFHPCSYSLSLSHSSIRNRLSRLFIFFIFYYFPRSPTHMLRE